jgi:acetyltransferase-like isoleucine patch superfamily enzyme
MQRLKSSIRGQIGKICWGGLRKLGQVWRLFYYQMLSGSYFKEIGSGTLIFGALRFGSAEGNISIGKNCMLGHDVFFSARSGSKIEIGDGCSINTGCHIVAIAGIHIGKHTHIAEFCSIRDQNHRFEDLNVLISNQGFAGSPIFIGDNVWIGRGVYIAPGVTIGEGAVIGANSVVTRDVESYTVAYGCPARARRNYAENRVAGEARNQ